MAKYQAIKSNQYMSSLLAAMWKKICPVLRWRLKRVWRSTGGRVRQRAAKRTRGFLHQQQEKNMSFQSKWWLLNEKEFLSSASQSGFGHVQISLPVRGFWELLHFEFVLVYFSFITTILLFWLLLWHRNSYLKPYDCWLVFDGVPTLVDYLIPNLIDIKTGISYKLFIYKLYIYIYIYICIYIYIYIRFVSE